jgi:hypothetical protein
MTAKEFREYAEEHFGWAKTARSAKERQTFLQMAQAWLEAADMWGEAVNGIAPTSYEHGSARIIEPLRGLGASSAANRVALRSAAFVKRCGPLLALELFNGHCVQGSYPTHPMLAQRYDLLRDKARGWVVYDLQAQGLTHALQRE